MKKLLLSLLLILLCISVFAQTETSVQLEHIVSINRTSNLLSVKLSVDYFIRDSVDNIGNLYIHYPGQHPTVMTFVNNDGSVTVCVSDTDAKRTHIYEFNSELEEQRRLTIQNEMDILGAFTKDDEGYYYFFFAKQTRNHNEENMATVKYNPHGEKIISYTLKAMAINSFNGVAIPFRAGTCRIELSGSMLAIYFARQKFNNHQSSYGFIINKDTFERIDRGQVGNNRISLTGNNIIPYVSHSFNQFILPVENGFLYADHGDAYPRSFSFNKFINGSETKRINSFIFPGNIGANATYAEMGGLAKTSTGYIFNGIYGRILNNPRNLFILTIDENLTICSAPVYITNYTREEGHAGHPKIVSMQDGRYLLLWELFSFSTQAANIVSSTRSGYLSTHMVIIDETGKLLSEIQQLETRLNMNDVLRFNPVNKKVYWAINDSSRSFTIYVLDIKEN
ncbi:MAG: hypothetical protein FWD24_08275 [Treponema sp.]|nr:hypothetical protein [Treponema sp.]